MYIKYVYMYKMNNHMCSACRSFVILEVNPYELLGISKSATASEAQGWFNLPTRSGSTINNGMLCVYNIYIYI